MDWRRLEGKVDRLVVGKAFAELVRLSFMKNGTADQDRPAVTIEATLHTGGDDSNVMDGANRGDGFRSRLSAGQAELFIDRATYTGPMPRKGDKVRALAREGEPVWEVSGVSDRYSNLLVVSLGQA
jgi:hypothetical protein